MEGRQSSMWKAFQNPGHKFSEHAKFTCIEKVNNASLLKQQIERLLEHREDFQILKLESLSL